MYPTKKSRRLPNCETENESASGSKRNSILQNKSLVNSNLMKFFQPQSSYSFRLMSRYIRIVIRYAGELWCNVFLHL